MAEYENDRALSWDGEITNEERKFLLLPEGDYPFTVTKFERQRWGGSAKMPPCPMAVLTLAVHSELGDAAVVHRLFLVERLQWKLGEFFEAIGQCRSGETFRPNWDGVAGATGQCRVGVREFVKQSGPHAGETGQANEILHFLPPPEPKAAPMSGGWVQGSF